MIDMERDALPVGSKLDIGAFGCCGEDILLLPPFALLLSLALGGAVHGALLGAGVASGWLPSPADLLLFRGPTFAGLFLVVCALEASAFTLLMKKKTNPGFAPVNGLATDGIYHVTRNPMCGRTARRHCASLRQTCTSRRAAPADFTHAACPRAGTLGWSRSLWRSPSSPTHSRCCAPRLRSSCTSTWA